MTIHFNRYPPMMVHFEHELLKVADLDICLIAVKAEASHPAHDLDNHPIFPKLIYLNQPQCNLWWIFALTDF
ncbi:E3 ubiquitin-protein ligase LOG2 [Pyrus ussuriensis x Pyrus communis]|uniref:E3 ubiquitin-protein ligase LOG2 n=1 Tax=Pyrus ussuriensis x Pyrus communis TaxID=2448454 RepID=A0A5N5F5F2_9ROSA|nr:E3 ubiquitin-protein ligase LOG2 [Pyrus ussuriensis x Pyrus communis]